jgi:hypothetical protein
MEDARKKLLTPSFRSRAVIWAVEREAIRSGGLVTWSACTPKAIAMCQRGLAMKSYAA